MDVCMYLFIISHVHLRLFSLTVCPRLPVATEWLSKAYNLLAIFTREEPFKTLALGGH